MKTPAWRLALFAATCAATLSVPAWMILSKEWTIHRGRTFKFLIAPVDPNDLFRGRYVTIRFKESTVPPPAGAPAPGGVNPGSEIFARIEEGPDGFARFTESSFERLPGGACLKTTTTGQATSGTLGLVIPFDRVYLNEHDAPAAEKAYNRLARGSASDDGAKFYAEVVFHEEKGVVRGLFVDGTPMAEHLAANPEP